MPFPLWVPCCNFSHQLECSLKCIQRQGVWWDDSTVLLRKGWARLVGKAVKYRFHSSGTEHGSCWSLLPLFQTGLAFLRSLMSLSNIFLPGLLFFTAKLNLAEIKNIAATKERKNREWNGNLVIFNTAIGQTSQGAPTVFSSIKPRG